MPSTFPGMDPCLEDPRRWPNVHNGLISASQDLLNRLLRPKYVACVEERVYVEADSDPARKALFVPDVTVASGSGAKRTKAVAHSISTPVVVSYDPGLRLRERRIEIRTAGSQTVTASKSRPASARGMAESGVIGTTVTSAVVMPAVASILCR